MQLAHADLSLQLLVMWRHAVDFARYFRGSCTRLTDAQPHHSTQPPSTCSLSPNPDEALLAVIALVLVANAQGSHRALVLSLAAVPDGHAGTHSPRRSPRSDAVWPAVLMAGRSSCSFLDLTTFHLAMAGLGALVTVALLIGAVML